MLESFVRDLRFGWRTLWRSPGFTLVAVLTLALGIGTNTAILGLAWSVLFRPLPFAEPERVVVLGQERNGNNLVSISVPTFLDIKERNRVFESLAMFRWVNQNLVNGEGNPERLQALMVSSEFLGSLGVEAHIGRGFLAEDDQLGASPTVMMSYELWQRRFGGDEKVVGSTILLDDEVFTVIGIFPPNVRSEILKFQPLGDLWLPIGLYFDRLSAHERAVRPGLFAIGRLGEGISPEEAYADLGRISQELAVEYPLTTKNFRLRGEVLRDFQLGDDQRALRLLVAMVALVLLIACVNLVNLTLSRYAGREQELRTRFAMGADRTQVMRLLMAESLLLAILSGIVGGVFALLSMRVLPNWISSLVAAAGTASTTVPILEIAVPLALVSGLLVGCIPAWQATRLAGKTGANWGRAFTSGLRLRRVLIVMELALATVALVAAGLMTGSLERLLKVDLGFQSENLLILNVVHPRSDFQDAAAWTAFFDQATAEIATLPGVEEVALSSHVPMVVGIRTSPVFAGDRAIPEFHEYSRNAYQAVSPNFFQVLGIPLLAGRGFVSTDDDRIGAERVVIINQSLADHFWPGGDAVGQRLGFEMTGPPTDPKPQWRRVVGVVGDVRLVKPRDKGLFAAYTPYAQRPFWFKESTPMTLVAKTGVEPSSLSVPIQDLLTKIAPEYPVYGIRPLSEAIDSEFFEAEQDISFLLSIFGFLALVLAMIGVFGLIRLTASARLREICIRLALGANRGQLAGRLFRETCTTALLGTALGTVLAITILGPFISKYLYGLEIYDPPTYFLVIGLLVGVVILATLVPVWQAVNAKPGEVLRYE